MTVVSGSWAPTSSCGIREEEEKGGKREQSNSEYSSKVLASKDLHYTSMGICVKGHIGGLNYRMPE